MRLKLALLTLILCPLAHGTTYTVPLFTGASLQSTINTASGAGSGNTVFLPAGAYAILSQISVPCNTSLTITGPVASPATAILSASFTNAQIFGMNACTGITIEYLQFKGSGGIYISDSNNTGISILNSQFVSLPSALGGNQNGAAIWQDGDISSVVSGYTITGNQFGDVNSCSTVIANTASDDGGYCVGFYEGAGAFNSSTISSNYFFHIEEGIHWHQICTGCSGSDPVSVANGNTVEFNYILNYHRIGMEIQTSVSTATNTIEYNVIKDSLNWYFGTFALSEACCVSGATYNVTGFAPGLVTDNNLLIETSGSPPYGIEWWGTGSLARSNMVMGPYPNGITVGYSDTGTTPFWTLGGTGTQANYICATNVGAGGYVSNEEGTNGGVTSQPQTPTNLTYPGNPSSPFITSNTTNITSSTCAQAQSINPTISPTPAGLYSSNVTVTLTDTGVGGSGQVQGNTTVYYTTNGSTPSTSSAVCNVPPATSCTFSVAPGTTVKAIAMWGSASQPTSYATPYGMTASAVVSSTYPALTNPNAPSGFVPVF